MRMLRKDENTLMYSGDSVYLKAHTGNYIDVEGSSVQARWTERGAWQRLTIVTEAGGVIQSGDVVFLTAHTGKLWDAGNEAVQARYTDFGTWQKFIIESASGTDIHEGDTIFLRAWMGKLIDVEGTAVRARWFDQGLWQSLVIEKHHARVLQETPRASPYADHPKFVTLQLAGAGFICLAASVFMVGMAVSTCSKCMRHLPTMGSANAGNKVHPCKWQTDEGDDLE
jgi:hypothetical protein